MTDMKIAVGLRGEARLNAAGDLSRCQILINNVADKVPLLHVRSHLILLLVVSHFDHGILVREVVILLSVSSFPTMAMISYSPGPALMPERARRNG